MLFLLFCFFFSRFSATILNTETRKKITEKFQLRKAKARPPNDIQQSLFCWARDSLQSKNDARYSCAFLSVVSLSLPHFLLCSDLRAFSRRYHCAFCLLNAGERERVKNSCFPSGVLEFSAKQKRKRKKRKIGILSHQQTLSLSFTVFFFVSFTFSLILIFSHFPLFLSMATTLFHVILSTYNR